MNTKISDVALPVVARYVGKTSNVYRYIAEDLAVVDAQFSDEAAHLAADAVPFGWVIRRPDMAPLFLPDRCAHMIDSFRTEDAIYLQTTVTPVFTHPQPAALNEVSGNSGELGGEQGALDIDDVRELFEEWAKGRDLTPITWGSTSYENVSVDNGWLSWIAAWKAIAATG
jgi:hypothetical protein